MTVEKGKYCKKYDLYILRKYNCFSFNPSALGKAKIVCGEDQTDHEKCKWHPARDKGKRAKVGHCKSLKYLGAVVSDDGSKPEVLSRTAQATATLTKLKPI